MDEPGNVSDYSDLCVVRALRKLYLGYLRGQTSLSSSEHANQFWSPRIPTSSGYQGVFYWAKAAKKRN